MRRGRGIRARYRKDGREGEKGKENRCAGSRSFWGSVIFEETTKRVRRRDTDTAHTLGYSQNKDRNAKAVYVLNLIQTTGDSVDNHHSELLKSKKKKRSREREDGGEDGTTGGKKDGRMDKHSEGGDIE